MLGGVRMELTINEQMSAIRCASSVYNPPSDPIAQLSKSFAILVAHDNPTRLGVHGDVQGFLGVAMNLNHAAAGRPSTPIEDQSALDFAAGRTFKRVVLIADHHHGVVSDYLHQTHLGAARHTTHRSYSLPTSSFLSSTMKARSNGRDPDYPQACVPTMLRNPSSCPASHTLMRGAIKL